MMLQLDRLLPAGSQSSQSSRVAANWNRFYGSGKHSLLRYHISFLPKHRRTVQLEAAFLFVRCFSGFFRVGKKKKVIYSWLPFWGHTHALPVRLLARFVLLSTHKLMQSFNQINAPFPVFATSFQWKPSSHMAELPIQPSYIVLHLGRWLVLFQLPLNKWGFNFSFISVERKTISMPFHFSVVCDCPDFTLAGSHHSCHTTQHASCIFRSTRSRTDVSLVLLRFWPGLMSHYRPEWPTHNTAISFILT